MADAGWDVYFTHRDQGFDLVTTLTTSEGTIVRPVQGEGQIFDEGQTEKGPVTAMLGGRRPSTSHVVIPLFAGMSDKAPNHIAWMPRSEILPMTKDRWRGEPARFNGGAPEPPRSFDLPRSSGPEPALYPKPRSISSSVAWRGVLVSVHA